jgi:hypothetical protein
MNKGIPTVYEGRQYRSRLEARWACFFDLLGWKYEYEPFDLEGWIPDFLLLPHNVLVEIKPVTNRPESIAAEIDRCQGAAGHEILLLGCTIPIVTHPQIDRGMGLPIGWMRANPAPWNNRHGMAPIWGYGLVQQFSEEYPVWHSEDVEDFTIEKFDVGIGLCSSQDHTLWADPGFTPEDDWLPRFAKDRIHRLTCDMVRNGSVTGSEIIHDLWNRAGNLTQWKGRQSIVS